MSNIKSFLLGIGTAYGVYYLTRKGANGRSLMDELLDNPKDFFDQTKQQAIAGLVETVNNNIP